jgi:hypothetical protein
MNRASRDERIHGLKAFRVEIFARRNDISRSQAFKEIAEGRLIAIKVGSRTLITEEAERAWQQSLPRAVPRAAAPEKIVQRVRPQRSGKRPRGVNRRGEAEQSRLA